VEWCSLPINYTGITPPPFTCEPVTIFNSNLSFTYSVPSGGNYELPDMIIESTGTAFSDTAPSVSTYTINDIIWTDSDGLTYSAEYGSDIVATPCVGAEVSLIVYDNLVDFNPLTQSNWGDNVYLYPTPSNFTPTLYTYYVPNESGYYDIFTSSTYFEWNIEAAGDFELMVVASDGINEAVATYNFEAIGLPR